ncbi:MAG: ABC transporter ATP-binding protein [Planctomycetes bacterium]|nr:ABC transporter ATP-binding protein [Planctomycetota bacterium]
MSPPEFRVTAENVVKRYVLGDGVVTAVAGLSLTLERGEMAAVVGRSGSGKSTLLHLLGGLDRPTSGEIRVNDRRIAEQSEDELAAYRRAFVGFVFQSFHLIPGATALKNVELPLMIAERPARERRDRAERLLEAVGLASRKNHRPSELSGGEQQRVCIARALANDPPLLLADEPTGNLDTRTAGDVLGLLRNLNRDEGRTMLLVTHDRTLAASYCRRIIELSDGRIVSDSPV